MYEKVQTNIKGKTLRSSLSQMFLKLAVLKSCENTIKKTPVLECIFNKLAGLNACIFIKKRRKHRCFLKKFLRRRFFVEHLTVHYTFLQFYVIIELFGRLWVQNWHFWYFLCHCFDFLHGCFHNKIFSKCEFPTHYNVDGSTALIESLKFSDNSWITVSSHSNLLRKLWIWGLWILSLKLFLFRSGLARHGLK